MVPYLWIPLVTFRRELPNILWGPMVCHGLPRLPRDQEHPGGVRCGVCLLRLLYEPCSCNRQHKCFPFEPRPEIVLPGFMGVCCIRPNQSHVLGASGLVSNSRRVPALCDCHCSLCLPTQPCWSRASWNDWGCTGTPCAHKAFVDLVMGLSQSSRKHIPLQLPLDRAQTG